MSTQPPSELHPLQVRFGMVCHACQTALSVPRANTSRLPSWFCATVTRSTTPPSAAHPDPAAPAVVRRGLPVVIDRLIRASDEQFEAAVQVLAHSEPIDPSAHRVPTAPRSARRGFPRVPDAVVQPAREHLEPAVLVLSDSQHVDDAAERSPSCPGAAWSGLPVPPHGAVVSDHEYVQPARGVEDSPDAVEIGDVAIQRDDPIRRVDARHLGEGRLGAIQSRDLDPVAWCKRDLIKGGGCDLYRVAGGETCDRLRGRDQVARDPVYVDAAGRDAEVLDAGSKG